MVFHLVTKNYYYYYYYFKINFTLINYKVPQIADFCFCIGTLLQPVNIFSRVLTQYSHFPCIFFVFVLCICFISEYLHIPVFVLVLSPAC
jgi:hypothetical protein